MEIFDTLTLMEVLRVQRPPTTYWLDSFFPRTVTFQTEEILFDTVIDTRRLAPFVAPNVQGRVMREQGYSTKTFRPAYAKPKHVVTPQRAIPRRAGETITGSTPSWPTTCGWKTSRWNGCSIGWPPRRSSTDR
jgi:hypothetical protein